MCVLIPPWGGGGVRISLLRVFPDNECDQGTHPCYGLPPRQLAFELPLNRLENREEKWPFAPSHQLLKTPPTLKYVCFPCCAASNIIDEERVDGRLVFSKNIASSPPAT